MDIEAIKSRVSLVDTLQALGVLDKGRGKALCPLHQDKTPSLSYGESGLWYCFVCGVGGDMIELVMKVENLSFKEALSWFNHEFSLGLTAKKPKRNFYLESLNENYEALKASFVDERERMTSRYRGLLHETLPYQWTAKDYTFEFCYHDQLDRIDDKLRALDDARYKLRNRELTTR